MMEEDKQTASRYTRGAFLNVSDFSPFQWEEQLERLSRLNSLDHIEVWLEFLPDRQQVATLANMLAGSRILVHGPFIHTSLATHWEPFAELSVKRSTEAIECAQKLGALVVTFHAGTYAVFEDRDIVFERLVQRFSLITQGKQPIVTLENMPVKGGATRECLGKLDDIRALSKLSPDTLFTLDIGHCLQNEDNFSDFLREFRNRVAHIHLHDGKAKGRSHLPLGEGELNLARLLNLLHEIDYSNHVSLETIKPDETEESWITWMTTEQQTRSQSLELRYRLEHSSE